MDENWLPVNPAALGYFERRPGTGVWSHPDVSGTFEPRVCENPNCPREKREFMGRRTRGGQRFCSYACSNQRYWRSDASYGTKHRRVYRARGRASQFSCVDCGQVAEDWSQIRGATGDDPDHYEPRCKKCHGVYDIEQNPRGEGHVFAKLTEARVREIRASAGVSLRELAETHGVDKSLVGRIRQGKKWKHVA